MVTLEAEISKKEKENILQNELKERIIELHFNDAKDMVGQALKEGMELDFLKAFQEAFKEVVLEFNFNNAKKIAEGAELDFWKELQNIFDIEFKNGHIGIAKKIEDYALGEQMPIKIKPEILQQAKKSLIDELKTASNKGDLDYVDKITEYAKADKIDLWK